MQVHVDPLGGWSGDMFVAAALDAFPECLPEVRATVSSLGLGPESAIALIAHTDHILTGRRFLVGADGESASPVAPQHDHHDHSHPHEHVHAHRPDQAAGPRHHGHHRAWAEISILLRDRLPAREREHATGIFGLLAAAEAAVHGVPEGDVVFHEVGAIDSIVDIVAAAVLIARIDATRWTASPLPLGAGRVRTQHGPLPVPAPATALLLRGLDTLDDGIGGERVTPTGAAIARYLLAEGGVQPPGPRRLVAGGTGFGTRVLPGLSNCLRLLVFDERRAAASGAGYAHRELGVVTFEVDDQSAEDLAQGLDHIRALQGVHDVVQGTVYGKRGRLATQVQVLVAPQRLEAAIAACFEETTTIGLRHHIVQGAALPRAFETVEVDGHPLHVKTVRRPGGSMTGKTEAVDVAGQRGHAARTRLRRGAEAVALARAAHGHEGRED